MLSDSSSHIVNPDICLIQGQQQEVNRRYLRQGQQTALMIDNMTRLTKSESKRNHQDAGLKKKDKTTESVFIKSEKG